MLNRAVVGFSLVANIANVGAQSTVQPDNPVNESASIQLSKVSVRFIAVEVSPLSTQAINAVSQSFKEKNVCAIF